VDWIEDSGIELTRATLPAETRIAVLQASILDDSVSRFNRGA
jgi:hypothetical protein